MSLVLPNAREKYERREEQNFREWVRRNVENATNLAQNATGGGTGDPFVGDSGSGGVEGIVPAPPAGSAAAGQYLKADGSWEAPSGLVGSVAWGAITGTLSLQTDLQAALDAKSATGHTHAYSSLTGIPVTFAPSAHSHSDFVGDSGAGGTAGFVKAPAAGDAAAGKYLDADGTWTVPPVGGGGVAWGTITGTLSAQSDLNTALAGKSDTSHTHAYSSLTSIPATFAPSAHTHAWSDVTGEPTTLAGYGITDAAPLVHSHSAFTGDSGSGGAVGFVPAPVAGDAVAGKYLDADGTWTVPPVGGSGGGVEKLTANREYYVNASTGSDSNVGSVGAPFATIMKAVDAVSGLVQSAYTISIFIADGTYNEILYLPEVAGVRIKGLTVIGNITTPANVIVKPTSNPSSRGVVHAEGAHGFFFVGITFDATDAGFGGWECLYSLHSDLDFSECVFKLVAGDEYFVARLFGDDISFHNCGFHLDGVQDGFIWASGTHGVGLSGNITLLSGTPSFTSWAPSAFVQLYNNATLYGAPTFVGWGSAVGKRFNLLNGGMISLTNTVTLPGSVDGVADSTSVYAATALYALPAANGSSEISGAPTTTELPTPSTWGVYRDSGSANARLSLNDSGTIRHLLFDGYALATHTHAWADVTGEPTTLAGYGITDAAPLVHTHAWADVTGEPTTLAGYGVSNATSLNTTMLEFVIDGGGSVITTGIKGDLYTNFTGTITACVLLADQSGSIVIDIWEDTYTNFPPVDADSITSATPPTISATTKAKDTTLASWQTTISADSVLRFNVDSCSTITRCTVALTVTKT